jgi:integrase
LRATPIDAVDIRHVTRWVQGLDSQGLPAKTIKNLHDLFSSTMKTAVRLGYCSNNPRVGCRPPEVDGDNRRDVRTHPCGVPTPAGRHDSALPIFIRSLVGTGFRWSEATALQVAAFDFNATTKTVSCQSLEKRRRWEGLPRSTQNAALKTNSLAALDGCRRTQRLPPRPPAN